MALLWIFFIFILVLLAVWLVTTLWFKPLRVQDLFMRYFLRLTFQQPELLTTLGLLEQFGINGHNAKLTDVSDAFQHKMLAQAKRELALLRTYPREKMKPGLRLSADIMDWFLDDIARSEPFFYHDYPLNQMFGVQSELPNFMATLHRIQNKRDAANYIKRLRLFGVKFDQVLEGLKLREEKGTLPPRFVIRRVLDEMIAFSTTAPRENLLFTAFHEKVEKLKLDEVVKETLYRDVEDAITHVVYPAYQTLIACFQEQEGKATDDDGVWKLPNGDAYYAHMLRSSTTTELNPVEVHQIGLDEVNRIEGLIKGILAREGYPNEKPAETLQALAIEPRFLYPNTDAGRAQALLDYQSILDKVDRSLGELFDLRPKTGVKVERVPEFKEKTSPGAYYMIPSMDGKRPGVFYANLRDMNEVPKWGMRTLAFHEGIPGHHFQLAVAQTLKGVAFFRRVLPFTAYGEGWALYAEKLCWENGFLEDPFSELGYLQSELFRAVRLVVDTGIHAKRWTRQEAIDYMHAHTGMALESIVSEVERYIVMPGQACAYKIGELKIVALREKARKALGDRFDIKTFHNILLGGGSMPLELLERKVDGWIAECTHST